MHTNLDHDIFKKQLESAALAESVEKFLKAQGKEEPEQYQYGYSALSNQSKSNEWTSSQQVMHETMTSSVSQNRPVLKNVEKPLNKEQQRQKFNFEAKREALRVSKDNFIGQCLKHGLTNFKCYPSGKHHCIECRVIIVKRRKELEA